MSAPAGQSAFYSFPDVPTARLVMLRMISRCLEFITAERYDRVALLSAMQSQLADELSHATAAGVARVGPVFWTQAEIELLHAIVEDADDTVTLYIHPADLPSSPRSIRIPSGPS